ELADYVRARPGREILVAVRRDGAEFSRRIVTVSDVDAGKTVGRFMVRPPEDIEAYVPESMKIRNRPGAVAALGAAVSKSWQLTVAQARFFVRMLSGKVSSKNISGFISI